MPDGHNYTPNVTLPSKYNQKFSEVCSLDSPDQGQQIVQTNFSISPPPLKSGDKIFPKPQRQNYRKNLNKIQNFKFPAKAAAHKLYIATTHIHTAQNKKFNKICSPQRKLGLARTMV